jgi:hypothetical protein
MKGFNTSDRKTLDPIFLSWRHLSEPPEGLVFEDVSLFKEALRRLPHRHDESAVPKFFDRQLIVLEDLGRCGVEAIGKAFHIPPRVFALHWASPSLYNRGRDQSLLGQPAEEHFILPYSEILPFEIEQGTILVGSSSESGVWYPIFLVSDPVGSS